MTLLKEYGGVGGCCGKKPSADVILLNKLKQNFTNKEQL